MTTNTPTSGHISRSMTTIDNARSTAQTTAQPTTQNICANTCAIVPLGPNTHLQRSNPDAPFSCTCKTGGTAESHHNNGAKPTGWPPPAVGFEATLNEATTEDASTPDPSRPGRASPTDDQKTLHRPATSGGLGLVGQTQNSFLSRKRTKSKNTRPDRCQTDAKPMKTHERTP